MSGVGRLAEDLTVEMEGDHESKKKRKAKG